MDSYFLVFFLALIFSVSGTIILFLVIRFIRTNRFRHTITGLIFLLGGIGIISIILFVVPSPAHQRDLRKSMLNLIPEKIDLIAVYNRKNLSEPTIRIQDQEKFDEWVTVLKTCQPFNPNHPRYDNEYMLIVGYDENDYLYELSLDTKLPNTVDMTLLERNKSAGELHFLGRYRCEGLFEFVSETVYPLMSQN